MNATKLVDQGKDLLKSFVRVTTPPLLSHKPIEQWPAWLGRVHDVKVPHALPMKRVPSPTGAANVNILVHMIEATRDVAGDIADCGVYRAASTVSMGLYLRQKGIAKTIYGFDSFEGFDEAGFAADLPLAGVENEDRHQHGFSGTSLALVTHKVERFHLHNIRFVPGYFHVSFPRFDPTARFCFVHLDVNLYESYKLCMEFFYTKMAAGGIILFDEYNDPPWPGCNRAVDEFLARRPEKPRLITMNNYQKYFIRISEPVAESWSLSSSAPAA